MGVRAEWGSRESFCESYLYGEVGKVRIMGLEGNVVPGFVYESVQCERRGKSDEKGDYVCSGGSSCDLTGRLRLSDKRDGRSNGKGYRSRS